MTQDEFAEWKDHPVTKEVYKIIKGRQESYEYSLGRTAGKDSWEDARKAGAIQAYDDLLGMEF